MRELPPGLPDPGLCQPFVPTETGMRDVVVAGRHRRRLKAGAATASTGLLAAAALLLAGSAPGLSVLSVEPAGPGVPAIPGAPAPERPAGLDGTSATPSSGRSRRETAAVERSVGARSPARPTTRPVVATPMRTGTVPYDGQAADCLNDAAQVCAGYSGPDRFHGDQPADITFFMCLAHEAPAPAQLRFPSTRQADVTVTREVDGAVAWEWGRGRRFGSGPAGVSIEPGTCRTWTTTWFVRDETGKRLPVGRYQLKAFTLDESTYTLIGGTAQLQVKVVG